MYDHGREVDDFDHVTKYSKREVKLGDGSFGGGEAEELQDWRKVNGMLCGTFQRGALVRVDGFGEDLFCGIAKTFRPPETTELATSPLAIGDEVTVALVPEDYQHGDTSLDRNRMEGMILSRRPRRSALVRPQPKSAKRRDEYAREFPLKVIAANVDQLLILSAVRQPALRPGLVERFLITAERGELQPILVLNKIDLGHPDEEAMQAVALLDIQTLCCSAETGEGVEAIRTVLTGKRTVLAGASGVGKSTLINRIIPAADAETRTVREKDQRGRHTTTQARIYELPDGGLVIDTPGIRELDVGLSAEELPWYFPEFEDVALRCKFNDCTHTHEPGCAVQAAVETGEIPPRRFESYLRMLQSIEDRP